MDSIETQILFGPHLLLLLSLPSPPSSRLRIWISGSQMLQCPLTPRLSRPCSLSHDFSFFPISDRPLRFHELPVIPSSFFFIFSVLHTPHTDFSWHSAQISDANLLSQVTQHITLLHSPASLCFPACVRVCLCELVSLGTSSQLLSDFSRRFVVVLAVVSMRLRLPSDSRESDHSEPFVSTVLSCVCVCWFV